MKNIFYCIFNPMYLNKKFRSLNEKQKSDIAKLVNDNKMPLKIPIYFTLYLAGLYFSSEFGKELPLIAYALFAISTLIVINNILFLIFDNKLVNSSVA